MRFSVPQFIEHEAKIIGPFTFKQFIYVGIAGTVCFFVFFTLGQTNFFLFLIISSLLIGGALILAFFKIEGRSLPTILGNFFKFSIGPKIFIWRKAKFPIKVLEKEKVFKQEGDAELPLKIAEKSQLRKLRNEIETKTK